MLSYRSLDAEPNWQSYSGIKILPEFCKETYVELRRLMKSANLNCRTILTFIMIAQDTKKRWENALKRDKKVSNESNETVGDTLDSSCEFSFNTSSELFFENSLVSSPIAKKRKVQKNIQSHDSDLWKDDEALLVMTQTEEKKDESSLWSDDEANFLMTASEKNNVCFHEIENENKDEEVHHKMTGYDEDSNAKLDQKCLACNIEINESLNELSLKFMDKDCVDLSYFLNENWKQTTYLNIPCFWHDLFGCEDCHKNNFSGTHLCDLGEAVMTFRWDNLLCENCLYFLSKRIDKGWWDDSWDNDSSSENNFELHKKDKLSRSLPY